MNKRKGDGTTVISFRVKARLRRLVERIAAARGLSVSDAAGVMATVLAREVERVGSQAELWKRSAADPAYRRRVCKEFEDALLDLERERGSGRRQVRVM